MGAWAENHGVNGEARPQLESGGVTITHFSADTSSYELLLYAVKGSGHRLGRAQMADALDYMGKFFLRHPKKTGAKKSSATENRK
jgi:hypothetical protein